MPGQRHTNSPRRTLLQSAIAASVCTLLGDPAQAADPVRYTVSIAKTGNGALDAAISGSSQLIALRTKAPAGSFAVVARARSDIGRLRTALDSFGYYEGRTRVTVAGRSLDDPGLPDALDALPADAAPTIAIAIDTGPLFHLRHVTFGGTVPAAALAAVSLKPGQPAVASDVLAAGNALLSALQEQGYALARVDPPVATELPPQQALDVSFHVVTGPRVDLGAITFSGLHGVNERYARRRMMLHTGELYQPSKIEAARQDLVAAGVFSGVQMRASPALDAQGNIPLVVDVTERPRHSVTTNVGYSTDLGGSAGVTWSHRNLFGNAEKLNLTVGITNLGGSDSNGLGYQAKAQFLKPDYYHRDQTLELDVGAIRQDLDAYEQTAATVGAILTRKLSKRWTASIGLTGIQEQIIQEGTTRDYTLVAVPITGRFDSTNLPNPLEDPLHGVRLTASAAPTESLSSGNSTFVILQGTAASYFDLATLGIAHPGRSVLAGRVLVGSAQGASEFQLPPDQRFYGGGSATVRGYKYQSIGPLFADGNPAGGAAIDAATIEWRQRVWGNIGAAVFADAGQVNVSSAPFKGKLQEGVGVGARYYTPIGPLRVDFAIPLSHPPHGDSFELYLGLGQAF